MKEKLYDEDNSYVGNIKNVNTQKVKSKPLFFKYAPLLDPYKYLLGKYDITNSNLFNLMLFKLHLRKTNIYYLTYIYIYIYIYLK